MFSSCSETQLYRSQRPADHFWMTIKANDTVSSQVLQPETDSVKASLSLLLSIFTLMMLIHTLRLGMYCMCVAHQHCLQL